MLYVKLKNNILMKKVSLNLFGVTSLSLILFAFTTVREGGITGTITPAEGASAVLAITGTDTVKAELDKGKFKFATLKEGTYKILAKAITPYKDTTINNVAVKDNATTDLGEIKLQQ